MEAPPHPPRRERTGASRTPRNFLPLRTRRGERSGGRPSARFPGQPAGGVLPPFPSPSPSPLPQGLGFGRSQLLALFPFLKKPSLAPSSPPDSLLRSRTEDTRPGGAGEKLTPRWRHASARSGAASPARPGRRPPESPRAPAPAPSRRHWPFKSLSARRRPGSARETIKILCRMKMGQVSSFLAPIQ